MSPHGGITPSFAAIGHGVLAQFRSRVAVTVLGTSGLADESTLAGWREVDRLGRSLTRAGLEVGRARLTGTLLDVFA